MQVQLAYGREGVAVDLPPDVTISETMHLTREHEGQELVVSKVRAGGNTLSLAQ